MNYENQSSAFTQPRTVIDLSLQARATFITRVYTHLLGAMVGFALIEIAIFQAGLAGPMTEAMLGTSWLLVLGAFMILGNVASGVAHRATSKSTQYMALVGFVLLEAVIFVPLLSMANSYSEIKGGGSVIANAGFVSLAGFAGLSAIGIFSRKDFSFLRTFVMWGSILALIAIVMGVIFGFNLGLWFSVAMVGLAGATILWKTQQVLQNYPEDRYVGASLELFAAVAMLFWYVLRIFMSRD
jgi:uncharacterized protein